MGIALHYSSDLGRVGPVAAPALCDWGAQGGGQGQYGGSNPHLHNSCNFDGIIFFDRALAGRGGGLKGVMFPSRAKLAKLSVILSK